jgi:hypothetical protein
VGLGAILDGCRKSHAHQGSNPKLSSPYKVTRSNCDHVIIFLHKCRLGQIDTDHGKVQVSGGQCPKEVFTFINFIFCMSLDITALRSKERNIQNLYNLISILEWVNIQT